MGKWEMVRLGDIANLITKGTTPTTLGYSFQTTGINFIKIESISSNGFFDFEKFEHISEECNQKLKRSILRDGDILFSIAGALGRVAVVSSKVLPANINQALALIRIDAKNVNLQYIEIVLRSNFVYKQFQKQKQGVAQLNLSLKNISDIQIPLPPFDVQQKIADVLDKTSELIELRKAQLDKLDLFIKSQFIEMFGDPVTNPKGWKIQSLKQLTTKIGSGATPRGGNTAYISEGISLIRSMNIYNGFFEYGNLAHITEEQAHLLDGVTVNKDDVFLNITGASVARSCIVPVDILPARVNQHVSIIRCNTALIFPIFLNHLLISNSYQHELWSIAEAGGATRQAITKQQIEELKIIVPPLVLQNEFSAFVQRVETQKKLLQESLEKMELNYNSLMQKCFRGEIF